MVELPCLVFGEEGHAGAIFLRNTSLERDLDLKRFLAFLQKLWKLAAASR